LAKILYVETNFVIGIAKGQDPEAHFLLASEPLPVRLVVPNLCFIESYSTWNQEQKQRRKFIDDHLAFQTREVKRDRISPRAKSLLAHLEQTQIEGDALINDIKGRLRDTLDLLSQKAEMIALGREIVRDSLAEALIDDPTDNLILWSILSHAREEPGPAKAFLSNNHQDFGLPSVKLVLDRSGIRYFRRTEAALGWLRSIEDPA